MRSTMVKGPYPRYLSCGAPTVGGAFLEEGDARGRIGLEQDTGTTQASDAGPNDGDVERLRRAGARRDGGAGGAGGRGGGRHYADVCACQR